MTVQRRRASHAAIVGKWERTIAYVLWGVCEIPWARAESTRRPRNPAIFIHVPAGCRTWGSAAALSSEAR